MNGTEFPVVRRLTILVEGGVDRIVVMEILGKLGLKDFEVVECGGKPNVRDQFSTRCQQGEYVAALVDADLASVADSVALAQSQLGTDSDLVFCAVPTIESWLLADPSVAKRYARTKMAKQTAERLPLPELVPYPKYVASQIFSGYGNLFPRGIAQDMNLGVAISRSPSLAAFVSGMQAAFGRKIVVREKALSASMSRDVLSTIVRELPGAQIVWRTVDGRSLDADTLAVEIEQGTETGMRYATELLRVARDLIVRKNSGK